MTRTTWTLSGLLAVALVLSYVTWRNPPESSAIQETDIVSVNPKALTRVVFRHWDKRLVPAPAGKKPTTKRVETSVTLVAKHDAQGRYWTVTDDVGGNTTVFTAGRMLTSVIHGLAPLQAYRVLGDATKGHERDLGLSPPKAELVLYRGKRQWQFEVGGSSYGSVRRYLAPKGGHPVYLVQGMPFRLLSSAARELMEHDVVGMPQQDMVRVTVKAGAKKVVMVQGNRIHRFKSFWAKPGKPDKKVADYGNWLTKVFRLRATKYFVAKRAPKNLEKVATLTFHGDQDNDTPATATVTLLRGPEIKGQPAWYVRSSHTRSLVEVSGGNAVATDLGSVLAAGS